MAPPTAIIPEVIEPDEALPADLVALRRFAYLMDEAVAIPGTNRRVGLDAGIGLVPGVGDMVGALLSAWIVIGALRHRVPLYRVLQMIFNIVLDYGIGAIPLLGDLFDWAFEENVINLKLLLRHRDRRRPPRSFASIALAALAVVLVILAAGAAITAAVVVGVLWLVGKRSAF